MQKASTQQVVLETIAAVGTIALVAVVPGMGLVLKKFGVDAKFRSPAGVKSALTRLRKNGYVVFVERNGIRFARLTAEGRSRLNKYRLRGRNHKKPKRWDGKWRLVTFDIPEKQRRVRDYVRQELREAGFVRLHQSLWVSPYDSEEFIALLKADQRIGKNLLYIVAERIEYDVPLKSLFNLS